MAPLFIKGKQSYLRKSASLTSSRRIFEQPLISFGIFRIKRHYMECSLYSPLSAPFFLRSNKPRPPPLLPHTQHHQMSPMGETSLHRPSTHTAPDGKRNIPTKKSFCRRFFCFYIYPVKENKNVYKRKKNRSC